LRPLGFEGQLAIGIGIVRIIVIARLARCYSRGMAQRFCAMHIRLIEKVTAGAMSFGAFS
jgi:hypothetical protein